MVEILGLIPARGASKGIPGKNKRLFAGKPLVLWTIEAALASRCTRVVVSTADTDIGTLAQDAGAEWLRRPVGLDELGEISATEAHALAHYIPDYLVRLQPTSPLRTTEDIDAGLNLLCNSGGCVLGVSDARQHPNLLFWTTGAPIGGGGIRVVRGSEWKLPRQRYREAVWVNGAFYGAPIDCYNLHGFDGPFVQFLRMPQSHSLDVDSELDWLIAEAVMANTEVA